MNTEVKARWIEALRSGTYLQGKDTLRKKYSSDPADDRYCCLGVLCNLYSAEYWSLNPKLTRFHCDAYLYNEGDGHPEYTELPYNVKLWSGVSNSYMQQLIWMNDSGHSFDAIADWIEEHL